jgi:hypothetical protein
MTPCEKPPKALDLLLEEKAEGFNGDVAAGQAGAAGGQDHVDVVALQPVSGGAADLTDVVLDDGPRREVMTAAAIRSDST